MFSVVGSVLESGLTFWRDVVWVDASTVKASSKEPLRRHISVLHKIGASDYRNVSTAAVKEFPVRVRTKPFPTLSSDHDILFDI